MIRISAQCINFFFTAIFSMNAMAEKVYIASWKVDALGDFSINRDYESHGRLVTKILNYIDVVNLDIIVFHGVNDTDSDPDDDIRSNVILDRLFSIINEISNDDWRYTMLTNNPINDQEGLNVVAWNRRSVRLIGYPVRLPVYRDPSDNINTWQKHPTAVQFSTGSGTTDFTLVPIAMRNNQGMRSAAASQRRHESILLSSALSHIEKELGDQDVIVLGNTYAPSGNDAALKVLIREGYRDLNNFNISTTISSGTPYGRFFVREGRAATQNSNQYVIKPADTRSFSEDLSSYYLSVMDLNVIEDDD